MIRPEELFKYYSFNAYSLGAIISEKLWFAKPVTFNDPFDSIVTFNFDNGDPQYGDPEWKRGFNSLPS